MQKQRPTDEGSCPGLITHRPLERGLNPTAAASGNSHQSDSNRLCFPKHIQYFGYLTRRELENETETITKREERSLQQLWPHALDLVVVLKLSGSVLVRLQQECTIK
ncbi:uncharacterized protein LOC6536689 [Drosophila yakuba]|uniref:uncharacterized protein LOC6536689 n=1 Tax=Drosophila yakuba TaxID=7245 RepID=UPI001930837F|nr:uncharacterized protein LOC6536689 [Drosophila yakuba]